ncbi:MAG: hypothetical protein C5B50_19980 [Verrucomicrobia bacterium]|nr:MAG: hypothetical protein C5B50_19980 [Verrucomicrobiota bacterium]
MITPAHIRQRILAKPFKPFRIFMSDGSYHDVPHSEFAWVFGSIVFVGVPGSGGESAGFVKELSILHVSRLEPLRHSKKSGRK